MTSASVPAAPPRRRRAAFRFGITTLLLLALLPTGVAASPAYRVETVASGLEFPWSLAFLPDGRMLVTERAGRLRVIAPAADGTPALVVAPVDGVPPAFVSGQAGLFDVLPDPDFADNGLLYLSFAHGTHAANHLRIVRARFDGRRLHAVTPIFTSQPAKTHRQHFGGRLALLADGTLVTAVGDGNLERTDAQRLHTHLGKSIRIERDGGVPHDNPFVGHAGARPEIYSVGHRNPQGLVVRDGVLYAHEHGAKGGDELNRIVAGANYGWPLTTDGVDYTGARVTPYRSLPGITAPLTHWTPSIAPSGMTWYDGALFPAWRGSLFVSTLAEGSVRRIPMTGGTPGPQDVLFTELGARIRDVRTGPDGALYLLTDAADGRVLRVVPD
ncbi:MULTISPECIES: PQQ-dependent sugar dehydrogenase [Luteimonas]|uniref:PQQ-dependent sugar dehydrogenase n=1 Tax=Luteimonas TaxID=83614 RepID=UPI000C7DE94B|nr:MULTISPECIES: PQQ-dependent sugar dehydrogenase [Luteimonas]